MHEMQLAVIRDMQGGVINVWFRCKLTELVMFANPALRAIKKLCVTIVVFRKGVKTGCPANGKVVLDQPICREQLL